MKMANIVDSVTHHGQAREAQAEGETVPLLRVNSAHAQNVGVHQAARQEFHPAAVFAYRAALATAQQALDIELKTRLDKREV